MIFSPKPKRARGNASEGVQKKKQKAYFGSFSPGDYRSKHECCFLARIFVAISDTSVSRLFSGRLWHTQLFSTKYFCRLDQIQACFSHFWSHILWRLPLYHAMVSREYSHQSTDTKVFTRIAPRKTRPFESSFS